MEGSTNKMLSWHVTDVSVKKAAEDGARSGAELQLQIRMPYGVLGRALVSLIQNGETVAERNLLLPGDMRMPAMAGMRQRGVGVQEKAGAESFRLVNAQVFLPATGEGMGMKISLFDAEDVCREEICYPII